MRGFTAAIHPFSPHSPALPTLHQLQPLNTSHSARLHLCPFRSAARCQRRSTDRLLVILWLTNPPALLPNSCPDPRQGAAAID